MSGSGPLDVVVIGGGQAGLSVAYFLRRTGLRYVVLDDQIGPGGAWRHTWETLRLFSPTEYSSIPGWQMPKGPEEYPHKGEFIAYLAAYENRYEFAVERPVRVSCVRYDGEVFQIETDKGVFAARAVVSCTGTAQNAFIPSYPGIETFAGRQMHSADFRNTHGLEGQRVAVVGGGNTGAQILAEVSKVAETTWVTVTEPHFMPDDIDGRYLFNAATRRFLVEGKSEEASSGSQKASLSNIVMVQSVREARNRGVLHSVRPFRAFIETGAIWEDGTMRAFDLVIWCTGFRANLSHLAPLGLIQNDQIDTHGTRAAMQPGLWLVGCGGWTGFASATIYGVQKSARATVAEIVQDMDLAGAM